jgi:tetratricopeptide (TPR) repeat protein
MIFLSNRLAGVRAAAAAGVFLAAQMAGAQSVLQRHYDDAQKFQAAGDLPQAARQYRIFIADALGELAISYARIEDYEKAAPLFDEALKLAPNSPTLQIEYAQAAFTRGELSRARSLCEEVIRSYPGNAKAVAKAQLILGRVLLKMAKDGEARKHFEAAVALEPNFENGYALAVACLDVDDGKCAANVFAEMLTAFGDTALIHREFGRAYGGSDFQPQAIAEFEKAIAKDDKLPGVHYSLAAAYLAAYGETKTTEAEAELRKELANSPNDALTYAALGHMEFGEQQYEQAERDLNHAVQLDAHNPDTYLYLGQLHMKMNRMSDAEAALRNSIRSTKDVSHNRYQVQRAHYLLGRVLMQTGHAEEGGAELQISATLTKQSLVQDRNRLADYLEEQPAAGGMGGEMGLTQMAQASRNGDEDAVKEKQLEGFYKQLSPAVADSYNNLGAIAAGAQDYTTALAYFARAAEWNPGLDGLDYNWGRAAFSAGQFAEAVMPLERALHAHEDDRSVRSMLAVSQFAMKDYAAVLKTLQPMEAELHKAPRVELVYAASMVKAGNTVAGIARLKALAQGHPEMAEVHRALAEALAEHGDRSGAEQETKRYEALQAQHPLQSPQ